MQVAETQLEERSLIRLSTEAVVLLCARDFDTLTQRFPYALACDRQPAAAVAQDLAQCFAQAPSVEAALTPDNARYKVGYFQANDITLRALVECRFNSPLGDELLVEMIVTGKDRMNLALEDMSVFLADPAV